MSDVCRWLEQHGLGEHALAFTENAIEFEVLSRLTDQDLRELGLPLGHRRKFQAAVERLSEGTTDAHSVVPPTTPSRVPTSDAERRQLTIMFCDLVGSTALSESMDPEEYREVLSAYQSAARKAIEQYDGYIARYMGDGLLVYFGYPQAHEEDSERAVRAGLEILDRVGHLDVNGDIELKVRIGIATGLVVAGDIIGEGASEERAVLGDSPNLAARLQGLAQPGQVLIDETTRRLGGGAFELQDLGPQDLTGFAEAGRVWYVIGEGSVESRFEASHSHTLTRLVGREHELGLLLERWKLAKGGEGQVVLLSGEAGIGKSRLVQALRDKMGDERHIQLRYQCSPHHINSAFYPIIQRLQRAAAFSDKDSVETKLDKLEALLKPTTNDLAAIAPLFAALLSLPPESRYGALDLSPERRRDRTFGALLGQVLELSRQRPVLFVLEDTHWIDPTSQDLVGEIIARIADAAVFMLITHRPNYNPPWTGHPHLTSLALNRLSRVQGGAIVQAVGGQKLGGAVIDRIVARADGVPLFVEELTRSVLEVGVPADAVGAEPQIPETLRASLTARLDRLGEAKEIAQIGAAVGREFSSDLITAVARKVGIRLEPGLDQLVTSGLVFRTATSQGTIYKFKHALVQETAYESMLKSKRAGLHRQIAEVLEREFPSNVDPHPEILARHYTEGNVLTAAIAYWQRAGEMCAGASANVEASHHFGRALELLATLPETKERDEWELNLQVASGGPLLMTKGHAVPEVEAAYSRARELSEKVGDTLQLVPALFGLWRYFIGRGDCRVTRDLGKQLLDLGERTNYTPGEVLGHYNLGYALFCSGALEDGRAHLEHGYRLYDRGLRDSLAFRLGQDPGVACLSFGALALWVLGYPDAAVSRSQEALCLADALSHPYSRAYALSLASQVYQLRGDKEAVLELSEKAIGISREQGFAVWLVSPMIFRGWARARQGEMAAGVEEMREGLAAIRAVGMEMRRPLYLALLAETYLSAGRISEARVIVEEALAVIDSTGERWSEAEQYRLTGEISAHDDPVAAEFGLAKALDIARHQDAKSWELRAAVSLARLWRDQGKGKKVPSLLEPVYEWFTEGFDSYDLRSARALLEHLS